MKKGKLRFIDLFAGIGGFHEAIKKYAKETKIEVQDVFTSEIDPFAIETYSYNFGTKKSDIINIREANDNKSVPDHDILFAGFPCQTFSNAGKKLGFLDKTRGTLFFEIAKIIERKHPSFILLENVKHLTKHNNGQTWKIICETLEELGYIIPAEPLILSPDEFGIPQDRKRVFIPGVRKDLTEDKHLSLDFSKYKNDILNGTDDGKILDYIKKNFLESTVDKRFLLKNQTNGKYLLKVLNAWDDFIKHVDFPEGRTLPVIWVDEFEQKYSLTDLPLWRKKYISDMREFYKNNKKFIDKWMLKYDVKNWKAREKKLEWQAGKDNRDIKNTFIQLRQSGIRCKKPTRFPTLVAMVQVPLIFDQILKEWRFLSTRENANLQSFPKDFVSYDEISKDNKDFYSYKQYGNSVNVEVVYQVIKELLNKYGDKKNDK